MYILLFFNLIPSALFTIDLFIYCFRNVVNECFDGWELILSTSFEYKLSSNLRLDSERWWTVPHIRSEVDINVQTLNDTFSQLISYFDKLTRRQTDRMNTTQIYLFKNKNRATDFSWNEKKYEVTDNWKRINWYDWKIWDFAVLRLSL